MGSRAGDWSPVGFGADPTPGDREMVEALVVHLRQWSQRLERQADAAKDVLDTRLGASSWSGLGADAFTDRLRALSAAASVAAGRHSSGVVAATRWSASLGLLQADADRALRDAEAALAELESAQASVAALGVEHAALMSALRALEKAYNSRETPAPGSSAPAHVDVTRARGREQETEAQLATARFTVEDAQERLDDAKHRARRAKEDYDLAERTFAAELAEAMNGAMEPVAQPELAAYASAVGKLSLISATASVNASLMDTLTRLTPEELAALIADNPHLIQQFWKHPPSPDRVAEWWANLTPETQQAFEAAAPGILGNLAGLPYTVRDDCNRAVYEEARSRRSTLTAEQKKVLTALEKVLADPTASLVCFNLDAPVPLVAVGFGDLDTADTVTWAAPGMGSDAVDATQSWSQAAKNVFDKQNDLDPGRTHAVVAWLGYDTPDYVTVNTSAPARDGSWRFANELDGTHATRAAHPQVSFPYVSVLAHSYGTTMAADALTRTKYPIDSFTMLGSAGLDTDVVASLSDLHVKQPGGLPGIYTATASLDYLAPFGATLGLRGQPNPEAVSSPGTAWALPLDKPKTMGGAQSFSVEGATLPDGEVLKPTTGHSSLGEEEPGFDFFNGIAPEGYGYLDEKTESLQNAAYTTLGLPDQVVGGLRLTG